MIRGRTGKQWLFAALAASASALLVSGCSEAVDPEKLPGVYRNAEGAQIELGAGGTFSATDVTTREGYGPVDFSGNWDYVKRDTSSDFVYLLVEDGELGKTGGIQLYTEDQDTVYFRYDPDGPITQKLDKAS
ncbi:MULTISPECIES: hypothetical protein [unclassified Streptomyces]|uniref:hypothetical protein n=1 Tax=unclassified Streptomyces TaxID=2593676 RepID=UPI0035E0B487